MAFSLRHARDADVIGPGNVARFASGAAIRVSGGRGHADSTFPGVALTPRTAAVAVAFFAGSRIF